MKKKFLAILISAIAAISCTLAFTGCGGSEQDSLLYKPTVPSGLKMTDLSSASEAYEKYIDIFNKLYDGSVSVTFDGYFREKTSAVNVLASSGSSEFTKTDTDETEYYEHAAYSIASYITSQDKSEVLFGKTFTSIENSEIKYEGDKEAKEEYLDMQPYGTELNDSSEESISNTVTYYNGGTFYTADAENEVFTAVYNCGTDGIYDALFGYGLATDFYTFVTLYSPMSYACEYETGNYSNPAYVFYSGDKFDADRYGDAFTDNYTYQFEAKALENKLYINLSYSFGLEIGSKTTAYEYEYIIYIDLDTEVTADDISSDGYELDDIKTTYGENILYVEGDSDRIYEDLCAGKTVTLNVIGGGSAENFYVELYILGNSGWVDEYFTPVNGVVTIDGSLYAEALSASEGDAGLIGCYAYNDYMCYSYFY